MLSCFLLCVLVSGVVVAGKPGQEEHKPCCAPRYFTLTQTAFDTAVEEGSLQVERTDAEAAYDSVSEQFSVKIKENFYNGTDRYFMLIQDYQKEEQYLIFRSGEHVECSVSKTEGEFPKECLPEDAKFVSETTLGDHDLTVDNWYYSKKEDAGDEHIVKTVQHEGCVPVGLLIRTFDKESGKEVHVTDARAYDFSLGICNREKYFNPPESCHEGRALAKPSTKMLNMRRKVRLV